MAICLHPRDSYVLVKAENGETYIMAQALMEKTMKMGGFENYELLATYPGAIPADAGEHTLLPACSSGYVTAYGYGADAFRTPPCQVAELTAGTVAAAYETVCRELSAGERTVSQLKKAVKPCFESADCTQAAAVVYEILYALQKEGRLNMESRRIDGAFDYVDAPKFYLTLK